MLSGARLKFEIFVDKLKNILYSKPRKYTMISFESKDFNLDKINAQTRLPENPKTQFHYRVYGLKEEGNPEVLVEYNSKNSAYFKDEYFLSGRLQEILKSKGIECKVLSYSDEKQKVAEKNVNKIFIGLRASLRKNVKKSAAVVNTIIHYLERKVEFDTKKIKKKTTVSKFEIAV
jgi:hypothetical protein